MKVALVTSDRERCGIKEHSNMLVAAVTAADPSIEFVTKPEWLDPGAFDPYGWDLVFLDHHRGLHSRWTPTQVLNAIPRTSTKVVICLHDTYAIQPDRLPWDLLDVCDALIVHEPCDLLTASETRGNDQEGKVRYWRQGVPELDTHRAYEVVIDLRYTHRPFVGTCGFAFPWKGFGLLCEAAAQVGWGVLILSHDATDAQVAQWRTLNPWVKVVQRYLSTDSLISGLEQCDATAFLYQCSNSGTSGAFCLGLAAGKPLLATYGCRQFGPYHAERAIHWTTPTVEAVAEQLAWLPLRRFHSGIVALRERDSWRHLGAQYARLFHEVCDAR